MKNVLKFSTVLSWINMLIGGALTLFFLVAALAMRNLTVLIGGFFVSSIVLHSYAALQLRRSIVHPARPLSAHTPTGIRFIGAVALFLGIFWIASGIAPLQSPQDTQKLFHSSFTPPLEITIAQIRVTSVCILLVGLSIALNVMLNFRLLRWYYFMKGMM